MIVAASTAMMTTTIKTSTNVKPLRRAFIGLVPFKGFYQLVFLCPTDGPRTPTGSVAPGEQTRAESAHRPPAMRRTMHEQVRRQLRQVSPYRARANSSQEFRRLRVD